MDCIIIGIAGGTGSGKSTFTNRLRDRFGDNITVIYHDNYYKRHICGNTGAITEKTENRLRCKKMQIRSNSQVCIV